MLLCLLSIFTEQQSNTRLKTGLSRFMRIALRGSEKLPVYIVVPEQGVRSSDHKKRSDHNLD